ncbi:hypothetical protein [Arthrobacter sp. B2a2-09]|uniref:hypothetical protein n=1 Tax=Arthrobacter sp. B2a2-09 TaxID=2952822 RepID=UPI0022CD8A3D|nr:hypothetical protein [Arthrobacter sp. B2a2-09]MCZ9880625.1 hypothetical protein [Arthrobacter sp. B2a2-09]
MILTITGDDKEPLADNLDSAIRAAEQLAMRDGRMGVLVTRHGYAYFTVETTTEVPFGFTHEKCRI